MQIHGAEVSAQLFSLLGVLPALGSGFAVPASTPSSNLVVISDRLWKQSFGADRGIVGKAIRLGESSYQIAGVLPLGSVAVRRYQMHLLGGFALLALILASVGLYGVISCSVSRRTQEFGIHRALGAQRRDILQGVLAQAARVTLMGLAVGLAAALALSRLLTSLLFEVSPSDPWTYLGIGLLLLAVALAASFIPARRAARIDPLQALRCQ